jgi:hypothetical protein
MKRYIPVIIAALAIGSSIVYGMTREYPNPDPNHTHADFAVWVNGTQLDFTNQRYMSEAYEEGKEIRVDPMRKYLHLHDGIGTVIHRHKPGLTLGEFMASLGNPMDAHCLTLDEYQFASLDAGWKQDFAIEPKLCDNGKFHWTMVVNEQPVPFNAGYAFKDNDKILLTYGASDTAWQEQWDDMTNEACLFSRTCPWRGEPPAENCIADPAVPCVAPEN